MRRRSGCRASRGIRCRRQIGLAGGRWSGPAGRLPTLPQLLPAPSPSAFPSGRRLSSGRSSSQEQRRAAGASRQAGPCRSAFQKWQPGRQRQRRLHRQSGRAASGREIGWTAPQTSGGRRSHGGGRKASAARRLGGGPRATGGRRRRTPSARSSLSPHSSSGRASARLTGFGGSTRRRSFCGAATQWWPGEQAAGARVCVRSGWHVADAVQAACCPGRAARYALRA